MSSPNTNSKLQGEGLFPKIFNVTLEHVTRRISVHLSDTALYKPLQTPAYMNGIVRSKVRAIETLDEEVEDIDLKKKENKTKVMTQIKVRHNM